MRVAIIGAGTIGLSTAVTLAAAGHQVTVIDPQPVSGATYHAGGMLAPAAEVVYQQDPLFPLMQAAGQWYPELVQLVEQHTDVPTGHQLQGTLVVAADRADAQHLSELMDYQVAHGMSVERITTREARKEEPALSPRLAGAVSIPGDHQVFPRQFSAAMQDAARNLGVRFVEDTAVEIAGDSVVLESGDTKTGNIVKAEQIVLANGLGAAAVRGWYEGEMPLQLRPVYGDILRLSVPKHLQPLVTKVIRGFVEDRPIYVIPRADDTVAIGATSREDGRAEPRVSGVYDLLRDAIRVVPGVEECDLLEATAGARPGTPDDLPYLGRINDRIVVSTGYFRHGILLTSLAAKITGEIIEGEQPSIDIEACSPLRHKKGNKS